MFSVCILPKGIYINESKTYIILSSGNDYLFVVYPHVIHIDFGIRLEISTVTSSLSINGYFNHTTYCERLLKSTRDPDRGRIYKPNVTNNK